MTGSTPFIGWSGGRFIPAEVNDNWLHFISIVSDDRLIKPPVFADHIEVFRGDDECIVGLFVVTSAQEYVQDGICRLQMYVERTYQIDRRVGP